MGRSRIAIGVAISLALHALLLFIYRHNVTPPAAPGEPPARSIAVWLRPPRPAAVPGAQPPPARQPGERKQSRRTGRSPRVIAVAPERPSRMQVEPVDIDPETSSTPADDGAPHFDRDAARRMARELANAPDTDRADTALARLPRKPFATESKAARVISQARRRDCKDGIPGGLLAPLILLMDKKDSGCQW